MCIASAFKWSSVGYKLRLTERSGSPTFPLPLHPIYHPNIGQRTSDSFWCSGFNMVLQLFMEVGDHVISVCKIVCSLYYKKAYTTVSTRSNSFTWRCKHNITWISQIGDKEQTLHTSHSHNAKTYVNHTFVHKSSERMSTLQAQNVVNLRLFQYKTSL